MKNYKLAKAADSDLREIILYTRKQWGNAQARDYIKKLEKGIISLAAGQGVFKDMSTLYPNLRMGLCEHQHIPNESLIV